MSTWNIYIKNSADEWELDGTISRPNENLETETVSTETVVQLLDGSEAYVTPTKKYKYQPFTMFFADTTEAFRTQLETYITEASTLKIVDHKGQEYVGRFTSTKQVWWTGVADSVDLMVTFRRDNSG